MNYGMFFRFRLIFTACLIISPIALSAQSGQIKPPAPPPGFEAFLKDFRKALKKGSHKRLAKLSFDFHDSTSTTKMTLFDPWDKANQEALESLKTSQCRFSEIKGTKPIQCFARCLLDPKSSWTMTSPTSWTYWDDKKKKNIPFKDQTAPSMAPSVIFLYDGKVWGFVGGW